jgi:hypothetical protein
MNSVDGVRPMMKSLAGVAERTGCAVVIIGHLRKSAGKSQYRGLGSIDIYAAARSVLVVGRIGEYTRAVVQDKSNLAPPGKSLSFELDPTTGFNWLGECEATVDDVMSGKPQKESQHEKAKRLILTILSGGGEVAANNIIEGAKDEGISLVTLKRAKAELDVDTFKKGSQWFWRMILDGNFTESEEYQENRITADCTDDTQEIKSKNYEMEILQNENYPKTLKEIIA